MEGSVPEFYRWKVIAFGRTPHERVRREPTQTELSEAVVIVVRFRSIDDPKRTRYATIRHPVGFGVLPFESLMADVQRAVDLAADRYGFELVEGAP